MHRASLQTRAERAPVARCASTRLYLSPRSFGLCGRAPRRRPRVPRRVPTYPRRARPGGGRWVASFWPFVLSPVAFRVSSCAFVSWWPVETRRQPSQPAWRQLQLHSCAAACLRQNPATHAPTPRDPWLCRLRGPHSPVAVVAARGSSVVDCHMGGMGYGDMGGRCGPFLRISGVQCIRRDRLVCWKHSCAVCHWACGSLCACVFFSVLVLFV